MRSLDQHFTSSSASPVFADSTSAPAGSTAASSRISEDARTGLSFDFAYSAQAGLHANPDLHRVSKVIRNWLPLAAEMPLWVADMPALNRLLVQLESEVEALSMLTSSPSADSAAIATAVARLSGTAAQLDAFLRDAASHASGTLAS